MSGYKTAHIICQNNTTIAVALGSRKFAEAECERMKQAAYTQFRADGGHQPGCDGFLSLDAYQQMFCWYLHEDLPVPVYEEEDS